MGLSFRGLSLSSRWKQLPARNLDVARSWWLKGCDTKVFLYSLRLSLPLKGRETFSKVAFKTLSRNSFLLPGRKCNVWLNQEVITKTFFPNGCLLVFLINIIFAVRFLSSTTIIMSSPVTDFEGKHSEAFVQCWIRLWELFRSHIDHIPAEGAQQAVKSSER